MIKILANLSVVIFIIIHLSSSEIYDPGQKHINYDVNIDTYTFRYTSIQPIFYGWKKIKELN